MGSLRPAELFYSKSHCIIPYLRSSHVLFIFLLPLFLFSCGSTMEFYLSATISTLDALVAINFSASSPSIPFPPHSTTLLFLQLPSHYTSPLPLPPIIRTI